MSSVDRVCWLLSAPKAFLYSLPSCVGRRETLEFFFQSPSLPATWQWHLSVIAAPIEQSAFWLPISALAKLRPLHYLPFSFKNGGACSWSVRTLTSTIDSPKPYHTSANRSIVKFFLKIPADYFSLFNQNCLIDILQNSLRSFLLGIDLEQIYQAEVTYQTKLSVSSNHMKAARQAQESG